MRVHCVQEKDIRYLLTFSMYSYKYLYYLLNTKQICNIYVSQCLLITGVGICVCPTGTIWDFPDGCQARSDTACNNYCQNGATCYLNVDRCPFCVCAANFAGDQCDGMCCTTWFLTFPDLILDVIQFFQEIVKFIDFAAILLCSNKSAQQSFERLM